MRRSYGSVSVDVKNNTLRMSQKRENMKGKRWRPAPAPSYGLIDLRVLFIIVPIRPSRLPSATPIKAPWV